MASVHTCTKLFSAQTVLEKELLLCEGPQWAVLCSLFTLLKITEICSNKHRNPWLLSLFVIKTLPWEFKLSNVTTVTENDGQICVENFLIYPMQVSCRNRKHSGMCFRTQGNCLRRNFQDCLHPSSFLNTCDSKIYNSYSVHSTTVTVPSLEVLKVRLGGAWSNLI